MGGGWVDIEDVLERVPIEDYIRQYVDLHEDGNELFGVCPLHTDTDPSFSVTPSAGKWYCFGCGKGGTLVSFVMRYHRIGYEQALERICAFSGVSGDCVDKRISAVRVIKAYQPRRNAAKQPTYRVLEPDHMSRFQTDWNKAKIWEDEGISRESMTKFMVRYSALDNRLVFPVRSPTGQIINVCGRTLDPQYKEKNLRKYTYLQSMGVLDTIYGLYENHDEIIRRKEIILFEGPKSVMKADSWGIGNTAAVLTNHVNPHQIRLLIKLGVRVVIAFDANVNPASDKEIKKLKRYVSVEAVRNQGGVLQEKDDPVDAGREVWEMLYERRLRLN